MQRFFKGNSGFTLVELLVTVAILGVLASLAIANFSVYKDTVYKAELVSFAHNAITAGQAGLGDGRYGIFSAPAAAVPDPQYEYELKFPGLKLPSYIKFNGAMNNFGMGISVTPGFYFFMFSCKLSINKNGYGLSFGSAPTNNGALPGLNEAFSPAGLCY